MAEEMDWDLVRGVVFMIRSRDALEKQNLSIAEEYARKSEDHFTQTGAEWYKSHLLGIRGTLNCLEGDLKGGPKYLQELEDKLAFFEATERSSLGVERQKLRELLHSLQDEAKN